MMTYEEVMAFAKEHYNDGGDGTYECMDKIMYDYYIVQGVKFTEEYLLDIFRIYKETSEEIMATAW